MMKTRKYSLIPFRLLRIAHEGDIEAINQVVEHFRPYMRKLAQRKILDEFGNSRNQVDPYIEKQLETKLILAILRFQLD
ncbi:TPA: helix-turn-helix domain-containing protein [Enterococcus faecium]|uniref:helix-turn-helix domain-containing protein n=1 Tax=Enterococcus TaxID=1350 RepID=UPI000CF32EB2|nr:MULTISPECIES: helix-turn-helix domain-containing protein [Enterococcus]EMF0340873.1 helix-turn-helix domain-containing protein [Enterococcus faecium]MDM4150851.1 helix-turn-helix domain-containing protein [Enterococcus faecalis]MDQ8370314.1 helix-turn-helix domain-containing protein [Enterococcus faecium]MDQ8493143.1 helix-turn-helix domain-containing protein [Enterococcus faecium]NSO55541.1 helix-turn-helix domain-containing protein [Enterococcus faecalis]